MYLFMLLINLNNKEGARMRKRFIKVAAELIQVSRRLKEKIEEMPR